MLVAIKNHYKIQISHPHFAIVLHHFSYFGDGEAYQSRRIIYYR